MTLAYTLQKMLEEQRAEIERDLGVLDEFEGEPSKKEEVVAVIPCAFWWWKQGSARAAAREYATPQRSINFTGGGIIVEKGADIRPQDYVRNIIDREGNVVVAGKLRVVSLEDWEDHTECELMRP